MAATGHAVHADDLAFLTDDHVDLLADHSVAGNPMRFRTGRLELRHDEAWRHGLAARHRGIVTAHHRAAARPLRLLPRSTVPD